MAGRRIPLGKDPYPGTSTQYQGSDRRPRASRFPYSERKRKTMQASFRMPEARPLRICMAIMREPSSRFESALGEQRQRAVFVASLNAVLKYLGRIEKTIHCRDDEPARCGKALAPYLKDRYSGAKIAQVGFQPRWWKTWPAHTHCASSIWTRTTLEHESSESP